MSAAHDDENKSLAKQNKRFAREMTKTLDENS